jgi:hypothetical protein
MRKAKVKLTWNLSPSDDVIHQNVKVVDPASGEIFVDVKLGRDITEVVLPDPVSEKRRLQAIVVVSDGVNDSDPAVADFTVPDLTKPLPVEALGFTYEVVDEPEASEATNS